MGKRRVEDDEEVHKFPRIQPYQVNFRYKSTSASEINLEMRTIGFAPHCCRRDVAFRELVFQINDVSHASGEK
jgi:hypothetical protein